jgi:uncharacterized protein YdhG (YjbR/CyaY superfamily)
MQRKTPASSVPADFDEYLARVPDEARATLEKIRKTIRTIAPMATEVISYQMPMFKIHGRGLVAFAAFKNHCSLFPMSYTVIKANEDELKNHYISKGTIRFTVDKPLSAALVKKIVKARVEENKAREDRRNKSLKKQ